MEEIKPLLTRIQTLKGGRGGMLSGTQLMAFFLQRRVQPLQHRFSKLWTFSGLGDSSRVSEDLMEKKDLDRRVRALTTLTKDHEIAELAANYFDSKHPLLAVCIFPIFCFSSFLFLFLLFLTSLRFNFCEEPPIPCFSFASSRGGTYSGGSGFCCF
jgi:hypothetical protein